MNLAERDIQSIWHPYTQMKTAALPIPIVRGEGALLFDENGNEYIDAISSWWVNVHGHSHPYIAEKVYEQFKTLEHVIFAGFTHPKAVELAERLLKKLPENQNRVFFSDNGSTAVEVALKMALQYWHNKGEKRINILAIDGAYHGDTFGAMAVSGRSAFTAAFDDLLFDVIHLPFPEKNGETTIQHLKSQISSRFNQDKSQISCFIFEPLVQGAAGMRMYSPEVLQEMISICRENNIITIADEVMTGFGRTGKFFATDYISENPDIFCLSKGLTGGTMAFGITSCSSKIYDTFFSDDKMKTFFHGHSFTANPVACAASCASLDLFEEQETWENISRIEQSHCEFAEKIRRNDLVEDICQQGTILAIELKTGEETSYFNSIRDNAYDFFIKRGVLLRPLGNVIYVLPPYCITEVQLAKVYEVIEEFLGS
ncbi:MAG: adenosylmethionine--8-amino-7-oxononanoate transaminase [Flavobacteriales bacterium]|nr:MAG: adenosylmethionine--8-amino-7-oxononanoate transaminase [Flavobacteriales bacterium]